MSPEMKTGELKPDGESGQSTTPASNHGTSDAKPLQEDNKIDSLFCNPFTRKQSVTGAAKEKTLSPKAVPEPGEEPLPELTLVESAVTIHEPKPIRNPFAPSSSAPSKHGATTYQPEMGKGKGRAIAIPEEPPRDETPRPATVTDSGSSTSRRSDRTRTESMATFSTATGASTIGSGSVAGDGRKSHVPVNQSNPGNIPLAGGRPIGRQASIQQHAQSQYAQSYYEPCSAGPSSASREAFPTDFPPPRPPRVPAQPKPTVTGAPHPQHPPHHFPPNPPLAPARRKNTGFFGRAKKLLSGRAGSK